MVKKIGGEKTRMKKGYAAAGKLEKVLLTLGVLGFGGGLGTAAYNMRERIPSDELLRLNEVRKESKLIEHELSQDVSVRAMIEMMHNPQGNKYVQLEQRLATLKEEEAQLQELPKVREEEACNERQTMLATGGYVTSIISLILGTGGLGRIVKKQREREREEERREWSRMELERGRGTYGGT